MRTDDVIMSNFASDDQHLNAAIRGDTTALGELLRRYDAPLRKHIASKIPPAMKSILDDQDVLQTAYLEVHLHIQKFKTDGVGTFAAWVRTIAECCLADALRYHTAAKRPSPFARVRLIPNSDNSYSDYLSRLPSDLTGPVSHLTRDEAKQFVEECLEALPPDYAAVLGMIEFADLSGAEVATRINRSLGAVYMLHARAQVRLQEIMGSASSVLNRGGLSRAG